VVRNIEENMQQKNAMKPTHDALLERFRQAFPEAEIQLDDESHLHVGHAGAAGGAGHFRVRVIDARFNGLQHIARHRLVYAAVSDWMPERVHALNISAITLEEAGHSSTVQQSPSK
jgi:BolA protein